MDSKNMPTPQMINAGALAHLLQQQQQTGLEKQLQEQLLSPQIVNELLNPASLLQLNQLLQIQNQQFVQPESLYSPNYQDLINSEMLLQQQLALNQAYLLNNQNEAFEQLQQALSIKEQKMEQDGNSQILRNLQNLQNFQQQTPDYSLLDLLQLQQMEKNKQTQMLPSEIGQKIPLGELNFDVNSLFNQNSEMMRLKEKSKMERSQKIERYKNKRRNWIRKISYDCRKRVADSRLRIKGRFISKKDSEKIRQLVAHVPGGKQEEAFNDKKNLNIEFISSKLNLGKSIDKTIPSKVNISKNEILHRIDQILTKNSMLLEKATADKILARIQDKKALFYIVREKLDADSTDMSDQNENEIISRTSDIISEPAQDQENIDNINCVRKKSKNNCVN